MSDIILDYRANLIAKGKNPKMNLPALARKSKPFMSKILPDPGMIFVSQDIVSLEPSVTAEMSGDPMYRYATQGGIGQRPYYNPKGVLMIDDVYLMSASNCPVTKQKLAEIFHQHTMPTGRSFPDQWLVDGVTGTEVCKDYAKASVRNFAKVKCLGAGYGMGARKFRTTAEENGVVLSHAESKAAIEAYWALFSGLKALRDSLSWEVKRKGFVVNPFGYRCTPDAHKAMNSYIQSSASGVLDVFMMKLFSAAPWLKFVAPIHDECIYQCPIERLQEARETSSACIDSLNKDLGWSTPIRIGFKDAPSFAEIK